MSLTMSLFSILVFISFFSSAFFANKLNMSQTNCSTCIYQLKLMNRTVSRFTIPTTRPSNLMNITTPRSFLPYNLLQRNETSQDAFYDVFALFNNSRYIVGSVILQKGYRWKMDSAYILNHRNSFENSLLYKMLKQTNFSQENMGNASANLKALSMFLSEMTCTTHPEDAVVLHLRIGDKTSTKEDIKHFMTKVQQMPHIKTVVIGTVLSYSPWTADQLIQIGNASRASFARLHHGTARRVIKHLNVLYDVIEKMRTIVPRVLISSALDPDVHVCEFTRAAYFFSNVVNNSTFSMAIHELRKMRVIKSV